MLSENLTTEFKKEYVDDIKKTVIAFANTNGGKIYLGVENDGTPIGVSNIDETILKVTNAIRDAIKPDITLFTSCNIEEINGILTVVINVQKGTACPYYLAGKGIRPEGVYVRQGSSTVPATETAILRMIKETGGENYEEIRSLKQELSFKITEKEFKEAGIKFDLPQKKTLHLINTDGVYSNLALLLSDQCVHTIKLAVFEGCTKTIFKDRYEFTGSLLLQLQDAFAFIDRYNRTRAEFEGLKRIDMRDYPPEAVREALLNALIHRDYSFSGSTLISFFDDRIEFVSLGGLVKGVSYNDIMLGVSILRNKYLANIFYRLHLIEAFGTGIPKITDCYANYTVKPKIEVSDNAFKITLPNTNYATDTVNPDLLLTENEQAVIDLFREKDTLVRKDVEISLSVSQPMAVKLLKQLTNKKVIHKLGNGKNTRYELA